MAISMESGKVPLKGQNKGATIRCSRDFDSLRISCIIELLNNFTSLLFFLSLLLSLSLSLSLLLLLSAVLFLSLLLSLLLVLFLSPTIRAVVSAALSLSLSSVAFAVEFDGHSPPSDTCRAQPSEANGRATLCDAFDSILEHRGH